MVKSLLYFFIACLIVTAGCAKPSDADHVASPEAGAGSPNKAATPNNAVASGTTAAPPQLNFPVRTPEQETEIKALKGGDWVPVKIDRPYLLLRGGGIRFERGDYFVQPLSGADGKVAKLLLAKNRGAQVSKLDVNKAKAADGSFAAALDIVGEIERPQHVKQTRAIVNSSGESASVWVYIASQNVEWRSELLGYASSEEKPQIHN